MEQSESSDPHNHANEDDDFGEKDLSTHEPTLASSWTETASTMKAEDDATNGDDEEDVHEATDESSRTTPSPHSAPHIDHSSIRLAHPVTHDYEPSPITNAHTPEELPTVDELPITLATNESATNESATNESATNESATNESATNESPSLPERPPSPRPDYSRFASAHLHTTDKHRDNERSYAATSGGDRIQSTDDGNHSTDDGNQSIDDGYQLIDNGYHSVDDEGGSMRQSGQWARQTSESTSSTTSASHSTEQTQSSRQTPAPISHTQLVQTARTSTKQTSSPGKLSSWGSSIVRKLRSNSTIDRLVSNLSSQTASVIDRLLENEFVTVEDFLLYEDLMVEFSNQNRPLLDFMSRRESLSNMISYVITPCDDNSLTARFADVSFEILQTGDMRLLHSLFHNGEPLWDCFLAILASREPLESKVASYFTRLLSKFFSIKPKETWYQIKRTGSMRLLLNHISEPAMLSVLQSFIVVLHLVENPECLQVIEEWRKTNPVTDCIRAYHETTSAEDHANIATLMKEFLECQGLYTSTVLHLCSKVYLELFLESVFAGPMSALQNGVPILSFSMLHFFKIHKSMDIQPHFECFIPHLRMISNLLDVAPNSKFTNSVATYNPPLGIIRFSLVEITEILTRYNSPTLHAKIVEYQIIDKLINLFFKYPWNNLLHNRVVYIIHHSFENRYLELRNSLFRPSVDLLNRLVEGAKQPRTSAGYHEHIMQIIGIIETAADEEGSIEQITSENGVWKAFVDSVAERDGVVDEKEEKGDGEKSTQHERRKSIGGRFTPPRW